MTNLTQVDRRILDILQTSFPNTSQPYRDIAARIGVTEEEVISRIHNLKRAGIIRRIGAVLDSRQLGYYSTLCALSVPEDKVAEVASIINSREGVTHNYLRDNELNMWFTLVVPNRKLAMQTIAELAYDTKSVIYEMPAEKTYKIKVIFEMGDN